MLPGQKKHRLLRLTDSRAKPIQITVRVNKKLITMELDTGASLSMISQQTFAQIGHIRELKPSTVRLTSYSGHEIKVLGTVDVEVSYEGVQKVLPLLIVEGNGPSLFGHNWLMHFQLNWQSIQQVQQKGDLELVLDKYNLVFEKGLRKLKGTTAKIHIGDHQTKPIFCKACPVPYAIRPKLEADLDRLQHEGIIERVQFSEWDSPIVPVMKPDNSIRICGDYKTTINKASKLDTYPLPKVDDLFSSLAGGKSFTKMDLSHAYQQVELDLQSQLYTTVNTHKGLYAYRRLPFGINSAPSIFQRPMENLIQGIPQVSVYIDDILITGHTESEHVANVEKVLERLSLAGMKLRRETCIFMAPEVQYLGHKITKHGIEPTEEKVEAIVQSPCPTNVSELKSIFRLN